MKKNLLLYLFMWSSFAIAQPRTENLVIVTLDGFRWQELFAGADPEILFNKKYTPDSSTQKQFWDTSAVKRREKLLPFIWNVIGSQGQLYGNRNFDNQVNCANPHWFSYPGYSEMLTGFVNKGIRSNRKLVNPNYTVLEYINKQEEFKGKVAAFSTWDVIPYIIRAGEAGIHAKCGGHTVGAESAMQAETLSVELQQMFTNSPNDAQDISTFYMALDYLKKQEPSVLYISFDKTDEHGHEGRYDKYLQSANLTDKMIAELWLWLQANENYHDKTTLLITTDHGRGKRAESWQKHGRLAFGSGQMWFAVLGPDTPEQGEVKTKSQYFQKQFAKTVAAFLGMNYSNIKPVGDKIQGMYYSDNWVAQQN